MAVAGPDYEPVAISVRHDHPSYRGVPRPRLTDQAFAVIYDDDVWAPLSQSDLTTVLQRDLSLSGSPSFIHSYVHLRLELKSTL